MQRDACKRLLWDEDSGRRVGDGFDRLPACQLIVLVLLNLAWGQGKARAGKRKAQSPSPSWPAEQSKALEASSSRLQRSHVVDSWRSIWLTASLMLVVAVTSSHLPTRMRLPISRVMRKERPVSSGSNRHSIWLRASSLFNLPTSRLLQRPASQRVADDEVVRCLVQPTNNVFHYVHPWNPHTRHATPSLAYALDP